MLANHDLITARMADSTRAANIPDLFKLNPNGIAPYIDGYLYKWTSQQIDEFPRVWRVCVTGDPALAKHARALDVERFDATPKEVEPYRAARALGNPAELTTVYCSRETIPAVLEACPAWRELLWWIATLDGQAWTPSAMVNWLRSMLGIDLDPERIKAIQAYPMGAYDMSVCFGRPGFQPTKPGGN